MYFNFRSLVMMAVVVLVAKSKAKAGARAVQALSSHSPFDLSFISVVCIHSAVSTDFDLDNNYLCTEFVS